MAQTGTNLEQEQQLLNRLRELRTEEQSVEDQLVNMQVQQVGDLHKPNGAAAAAVLSAAIGVLVIGLLTTLSEASGGISAWLNWYNPTGALSGKTTLGSVIWIAVWLVAHFTLHNKELNLARIVQVSAALIGIGMLLMFPPVFELFA